MQSNGIYIYNMQRMDMSVYILHICNIYMYISTDLIVCVPWVLLLLSLRSGYVCHYHGLETGLIISVIKAVSTL